MATRPERRPRDQDRKGRQEAALHYSFGIGTNALNRSDRFVSQPLANAADRDLHFTLNHYTVSPQLEAEHKTEKRKLLRMEFATFCAAFIQMPCQIVRGGRRLIYRLLSWNPWQDAFLRLAERLHSCWLC